MLCASINEASTLTLVSRCISLSSHGVQFCPCGFDKKHKQEHQFSVTSMYTRN